MTTCRARKASVFLTLSALALFFFLCGCANINNLNSISGYGILFYENGLAVGKYEYTKEVDKCE